MQMVKRSPWYVAAPVRQRRKRNDTEFLARKVEIALGMEVMVTMNVETELDIANGSRGGIVGIVLHPDEPAYPLDEPVVDLQFMPAYVLVKMSRTKMR